MAQLVKLDDRSKGIQAMLNDVDNKRALMMSVPRTLGGQDGAARLLRIAFNAVCYDDKLVLCTQRSIMAGIFEALKLGLTLGGPMQEAWLIPYKETATFVTGYQGYRNLIDRSRSVLDLHPRAVYANDHFDFEFGSNPRIQHKPAEALGLEQGEFVAAYSVARLRGGGLQMEVMFKSEIDKHRARSMAKNNGPWVTDYVPMALKTTIRKIAKYLPKSGEAMYSLNRVLELDEKADMGMDQGLILPEGVKVYDGSDQGAAPPASRTDTLKKALAERTGTTIEHQVVDELADIREQDRVLMEREKGRS
jgi:recombination protein RecT